MEEENADHLKGPHMERHYYAFLLRIWQAESTIPSWLASLEDPHSRQVRSFAGLEALCAYLLEGGFEGQEPSQAGAAEEQPS